MALHKPLCLPLPYAKLLGDWDLGNWDLLVRVCALCARCSPCLHKVPFHADFPQMTGLLVSPHSINDKCFLSGPVHPLACPLNSLHLPLACTVLLGDWDLLVSPHIINDKVCFNCWRSQAGSLEGPASS